MDSLLAVSLINCKVTRQLVCSVLFLALSEEEVAKNSFVALWRKSQPTTDRPKLPLPLDSFHETAPHVLLLPKLAAVIYAFNVSALTRYTGVC